MILAGLALGALLWAHSAGSPWGGAILAVCVLTGLAAQGALYRTALGSQGCGPGGLQWSGLEWRLAAANGLTIVFLVILGSLALVVVLSASYGMAASGAGFVDRDPRTWAGAIDPRGKIVLGCVWIVCAAALAWAWARVCLACIVTAASGRLQVLRTWPLTRQWGWRIVVTTLAQSAPVLVLCLVVKYVTRSASRLGELTGDFTVGLICAGLWLPLSVGLMRYLYRQLSPSEV